MTLRPDSYWQGRSGAPVRIEGLAKSEPIDGQPVYWTSNGNWYAEDGRYVGCRELPRQADDAPYAQRLESYLFAADNWRSIEKEITKEEWEALWNLPTH